MSTHVVNPYDEILYHFMDLQCMTDLMSSFLSMGIGTHITHSNKHGIITLYMRTLHTCFGDSHPDIYLLSSFSFYEEIPDTNLHTVNDTLSTTFKIQYRFAFQYIWHT